MDVSDTCPNHPEDLDGFQDEDGCPDPDNDRDGTLDINDKCKMKPETVHKFEDADGCPDHQPNVSIVGRYVTIKGKVHFDTNRATIKAVSFDLLNEVAEVLKTAKSITKLRIEGHTDHRGSNAYNKRLSQRRASSVRAYLLQRGISANRLVAPGYREKRPKAKGRTDVAMAENRRVDFFILEIDGKPVQKDAKAKVR
jgi:outer membrane protein OmpA-like peptidoglycan-associated protein